jgi:thymidylate synthase (FAD)
MKIQTTSEITVKLIDKMGGDRMIVAAARVSTNGEDALALIDDDPQASAGLINYLIKQRHGSPFEHSAITFFVHAPIFVWREWHRHRVGFSYNEASARYMKLEPVFYVPPLDRPMLPVEGFKSARPMFTPVSADDHEEICRILTESYQASYTAYETLLGEDEKHPRFDRGVARACLPVGIYASCWVTCNPRSLMHFLSLRTHHEDATYVSYPLWEIEIAAGIAEKFLAEGWPITYEAYVGNGRVSP